MQNEAQYDLDRKAANISALSPNNLDKYEYLTGKDLGLKPSTVEQTKFEYSPLGKIFNKGLSEDDKKEGLFKRLKNIEGKNEVHLQAIKDQGKKQLKELKNIDKSKTLKAIDEIRKKNAEANRILFDIKKIDETLDNAELVCTKTDGTKYDFNRFAFPLKFIEKFIIMKLPQMKQKTIKINQRSLESGQKTIKQELIQKEEKNNVLKSAVELFRVRENIIVFFLKKEFFRLKVMYLKQKKQNQKKNWEKNQKKNLESTLIIL